MNLQTIVSVPKGIMARRVGDEVVVLDLERGEYFGLPAVGARIWELLSDEKSLGQVVEAIVIEYNVDRDTAELDLIRLAEDLVVRGLLISTPPSAGPAASLVL